jgi:cytochrome c551/c552
VLPLLKRRCFGCHTGAGVAADEHDFSRIEALRGAGTEIVDEVSTCAMPPRVRLGDDEASTLLRWVACGERTD